MELSRFSTLLRNAAPCSLRKLLPFSSSSSSVVKPKFSDYFSDDPDGGSPVYRHKLRFQRPTTIKWREQFYNSVSFIGSVVFPLKKICVPDRFGVCTFLEVRSSRCPERSFRILLSMWDKMGETSYKHLRRNDLIYVSGQLGSYKKVDANGELKMYYKVIVKELNYVAQNGRQQCCQKPEKSGPKEETISTSSMSDKNSSDVEQKKRDRLYLWQVFFANTYEWWDNRRGKTNSKSPDFKHKDTGEVLWIDERDPPWVKRLLQLHDSTMLERGHQELVNRRPRMTLWKFE